MLKFFVVEGELAPTLSCKPAEKKGVLSRSTTKGLRASVGWSTRNKISLSASLMCSMETLVPYLEPILRPSKRIRTELRDRVKLALDRLVNAGAFIMVDEPTASVNQMAVATKKGASQRTCIGSTIPEPHIKAPTLSSSSP